MNALILENLRFAYEEDSSRTVIDNLSLSVRQGEYVALAGANGSGKSTLARLICGFLQPLSGSVRIADDLNLSADSYCDAGSAAAESASLNSVPSGMVFQSPRDQLVANTVERDTAFGPQNLRLSYTEVRRRTTECLGLVGLLEKAAFKTVTLSSGQKQKLAFAGIMALHPRLLVLDEALSMIDGESRAALLAFVAACHRAGSTIIQVTHARDEIERCDRVLFLHKGQLAFDGAPSDFFVSRFADIFTMEFPCPIVPSKNADVSLRLRGLSFSYVDSAPLFKELDLAFAAGTLTALMGKSGSGKSTLMELASGLLEPQGGKVYAKNRPLLSPQESEAALFEDFAADDVAFGLISRGIGGSQLRQQTCKAMDAAGLPFGEFAERRTFSLSGGEKRKLSLAGIIALDSDVYFFDEPTAGLDAEARAGILNLLVSLASAGKTVVFSTHRDEEATCANRVITLEGGAVVSDTAPPRDSGSDSLAEQKPLEGAKTVSVLQAVAPGSYSAIKSPVHQLRPVVKYLFLLVFFCAGIALNTFLLLGVLIGLELVYAAFARYPFTKIARNFANILPWIAFFFLLQVLFFAPVAGDPVLFALGSIAITGGKLLFAARTLLHYLAVLVPLSVFVFSTDEGEILDGMRTLLFPLSLLRLPTQHAVLITGMLFRFVPLLAEEAALILKAQLVRNGGKLRRGLFKKVRSMLPVFIPLILQTLKRAASLADALDARYYGKGRR